MPHTNASFSPMTRSKQLQMQIAKLETLGHQPIDACALAEFDVETEQLLSRTLGVKSTPLETYKYATLAKAETMVNLPAEAQEPLAQDLPKKALQQRRQVLEGCVSEMQAAESEEAEVLTGEDHEDPPSMS
jgi:hypothetical protein